MPGAVVVFFFEVYSNVTTALVAISGYLISIGAAYTIYTATQRTGVQEKFLDYRALAEGMRVALFWRLAGLNSSPASYYLSKQQSELDWIRYAIKHLGAAGSQINDRAALEPRPGNCPYLLVQ